MREAVSDILEERAQLTDGLSRMVIVSLVAHGLLLSTLIFMPQFWGKTTVLNEKVMVITLGGTEGPETGGMNPLSARPVQEVAPPAPRVREAPPAPKAPEMALPELKAKPAPKTPVKPVEKPAESSRKPTTGAEVKTGSAVAETGSPTQVPFGGLSTGGGGTGARLDVQNFCCPAYLQTMQQMIVRNWKQNQGIAGKVTMRFVVQRDGRLTDIAVEESGGQFLDLTSQRALVMTRQIPPLPREYLENTLTVQFVFNYRR
jgi:TonB family protein